MQKKVLVTGGTGFIGKHILPHLLDRAYETHLVSSRLKENFSSNPIWQNRVIIHHQNLLNCHTHQKMIEEIKPTHLLHAAWYTEHGKFWEAEENIAWQAATISLANAFYQSGGMRMLGLGTCAEYDWSHGLCIESKTPENPLSLYGKIKKSTFEQLNALAGRYAKNFVWGRIFFPFGAEENKNRLIPYVITRLLRNQTAECSHGNQVRDFLHVSDMGCALAAILDSHSIGPINVGSGIPITIKEMVNHIGSILGKQALIQFGAIPEPAYSPPMIVAKVDRLKNEIGWSPALSQEMGLLNTIKWWQDNLNTIGV